MKRESNFCNIVGFLCKKYRFTVKSMCLSEKIADWTLYFVSFIKLKFCPITYKSQNSSPKIQSCFIHFRFDPCYLFARFAARQVLLKLRFGALFSEIDDFTDGH